MKATEYVKLGLCKCGHQRRRHVHTERGNWARIPKKGTSRGRQGWCSKEAFADMDHSVQNKCSAFTTRFDSFLLLLCFVFAIKLTTLLDVKRFKKPLRCWSGLKQLNKCCENHVFGARREKSGTNMSKHGSTQIQMQSSCRH